MKAENELFSSSVPSPIGAVHFAAKGDVLVALVFDEHWPSLRDEVTRRFGRAPTENRAATRAFAARIEAYFAGELDALDALAADPGGTAFQARVWKALRTIPTGETRSYRDIARAIGSPEAVRAVGAANGRNPVSLVLPCHRVIGADGSLTGYGGGLDRKRWLLHHERARPALEASMLAFDRDREGRDGESAARAHR